MEMLTSSCPVEVWADWWSVKQLWSCECGSTRSLAGAEEHLVPLSSWIRAVTTRRCPSGRWSQVSACLRAAQERHSHSARVVYDGS